MTDYLAENRNTWNHWSRINFRSDFYGVEEFKAGQSVRPGLDRLDNELLGEVRGKSLLHLMCHFGLDTLAQARRGARVTGVDFSSEAIASGRRLALELEIEAEFVESDIYELRAKTDQRFDLVFTSHGVLPWLPDLPRWARLIERCLNPGGRFVLVEAHPTALIFDDRSPAGDLVARYPYFGDNEPLRFAQTGCYTEPDDTRKWVLHEWQHSLSAVLQAVIGAGLQINQFEEYAYLAWKLFPWMVQRDDGCFELPEGRRRMPLMFSLVAAKPNPETA